MEKWEGSKVNKFKDNVCESKCKKGLFECNNCICTKYGKVGDERENVWDELKGCTEACEGKGGVLVIGDMNARVGDREVEVVIGEFGIP